MKFFRAFYLTGSTSAIVTLIAFLTNIIVTRYIGPDGRGKYSIVSNLILIFTLVLGEGIRRNNILVIGRKSKLVKEVFQHNTYTFLGLLILSAIMFFMSARIFETILKIETTYFLIALVSALLGIYWKSIQAIFLGLQDYLSYNLIFLFYTLGIFLINFILIFIVQSNLDAILYTFISVACCVILFELFRIYPSLKDNQPHSETVEHKNVIIRATMTSIAGFILIKGDIFIINYFSSSSVTGIYSIAKIFIDLFQKLPLVLGPIVLARSASLNSQKEVINVAKISRVLVAINILFITCVYFFGDDIIKFLFTESFLEAYNYLLFFLPSLILYSSGHVINAFLMGQGFPYIVIFNSLLFAITNSLLNIYFIPIYGVYATPIICSSTFLLWAIVFIIYVSKHYKIRLLDMIIIKKSDFHDILKMVR